MPSQKDKSAKPEYNAKEIEKHWQDVWEKEKIYETDLDNPSARPKGPFYNLMMFPYPSAEGLHVGNVYTFGGIDAYGRFKRMQGYNVFQPFGLDGFGIHSENYAIKVGRTPQEHADISEKHFYEQMHEIGNGYDWSRKVETYKPEYYKWTQWLFIELFKAGLAYKDKASVNFCPSCKTVLSDEQVIDGKCERCSSIVEKRDLEQWFFRITDYAERLLANTENLDWTEKVKLAQKNWIGKKTGALVKFKVPSYAKASAGKQGASSKESEIEVFTTRPDTLFGATFLVVAPEHPLVSEISNDNLKEIQEYVKSSSLKEAQERTAEGKEKTGVFSGVYAINPVNDEKIPVWIADYVLMDYGTGAIMAVPAHDERDYQFARKYDLPIKQVIAPETGIIRHNENKVYGGCAVIFNPDTQRYGVFSHPNGLLGLFSGGVNDGESLQNGVLREVKEESGLFDFKHFEEVQSAYVHFYNRRKKSSRAGWANCYLFILKSDKRIRRKLEPHEKDLKLEWMRPEEILTNWEEHNQEKDVDHWIMFLKQAVGRSIELGYDKTSNSDLFKSQSYTGEGIIINSSEWNDWRTPESIEKVCSWLEEKGIGKKSVNYHLRDWLISRQRYWGPPIPMVYCEVCARENRSWFSTEEAKKREVLSSKYKVVSKKSHTTNYMLLTTEMKGWYPVPKDQLPVLLPVVDDFKPLGTGKAPLANYPEFYKTICPGCGGEAIRETDVSDTFLDSSWYFFRYLATDRDDIPMPMKDNVILKRKSEGSLAHARNSETSSEILRSAQNDKLEKRLKWLPVTSYIGGAEHAVLHLLYSRFITMVFKDLGYIDFEEPYARFRANGLIIKDGAKMSKSKGNVINPDDYVKKFGADTLRTYLGFIGPFTQGGDFQDSGIEGINRFLKRVWKLVISQKSLVNGYEDKERTAMLNKTVKGVSEDMEELRFNTAIAKIMTYYNFLSDQTELSREEIEVLLKLLAPFAPHMTEELWQGVILKDIEGSPANAGSDKLRDSSASPQNDKNYRSIHLSKWPHYDIDKISSDTVIIAVQINGKLRDTLQVNSLELIVQSSIEQLAKESENVKKYLEGQEIKKVIYVPGKIINFVV